MCGILFRRVFVVVIPNLAIFLAYLGTYKITFE